MRRLPKLRRIALWCLGLFCVLVGVGASVGCAFSAPRWNGPVTDHFDGERFHTPNGVPRVGGFDMKGIKALLKWMSERKRTPWKEFHQEAPGARPLYEVPQGAMRVTFINHATTLIQMDQINILTDPIYSERCSPVSFAGPSRVRPPGIRFEDLPRIDAVVVSHNHYDHMDVPTLKRIASTWPKVIIYVGLGNRAFLASQGLDRVREFDWGQHEQLGTVTVTSVPVQHFSNRGIFDSDGTLWTGWAFTGPSGKAYFGGDTGYGPHFKNVGDTMGPFRLAVLPIGAYIPEWFMSPIHMTPAQAVEAVHDLRASFAIPMHYGTFPLADDGEEEPVEALAEALKAKPAPFRVLGFGEAIDVPPAEKAPAE